MVVINGDFPMVETKKTPQTNSRWSHVNLISDAPRVPKQNSKINWSSDQNPHDTYHESMN